MQTDASTPRVRTVHLATGMTMQLGYRSITAGRATCEALAEMERLLADPSDPASTDRQATTRPATDQARTEP